MNAKHTLLITALFAATFSTSPVDASDLMNWGGFYAGLNAGAAIGTAKMDFNPSGSFRGPTAADIADGNFWHGSRNLDSTSFTGGLHAGYQQTYGRFVLGLETEVDYLGLRKNSSITATVPASGNSYILERRIKTDVFSSLRPRVGYVPDLFSGNLLVFTTGGLTLTHAQVDQKFTQTNVAYSSQGLQEDRLLIGWVAGAGVEYALSQQWSLKAEYLYANLGSVENNNASGNAGFSSYTTDNHADLTSHFLRLGAAFHF